jgi:hypothetical protein
MDELLIKASALQVVTRLLSSFTNKLTSLQFRLENQKKLNLVHRAEETQEQIAALEFTIEVWTFILNTVMETVKETELAVAVDDEKKEGE